MPGSTTIIRLIHEIAPIDADQLDQYTKKNGKRSLCLDENDRAMTALVKINNEPEATKDIILRGDGSIILIVNKNDVSLKSKKNSASYIKRLEKKKLVESFNTESPSQPAIVNRFDELRRLELSVMQSIQEKQNNLITIIFATEEANQMLRHAQAKAVEASELEKQAINYAFEAKVDAGIMAREASDVKTGISKIQKDLETKRSELNAVNDLVKSLKQSVDEMKKELEEKKSAMKDANESAQMAETRKEIAERNAVLAEADANQRILNAIAKADAAEKLAEERAATAEKSTAKRKRTLQTEKEIIDVDALEDAPAESPVNEVLPESVKKEPSPNFCGYSSQAVIAAQLSQQFAFGQTPQYFLMPTTQLSSMTPQYIFVPQQYRMPEQPPHAISTQGQQTTSFMASSSSVTAEGLAPQRLFHHRNDPASSLKIETPTPPTKDSSLNFNP